MKRGFNKSLYKPSQGIIRSLIRIRFTAIPPYIYKKKKTTTIMDNRTLIGEEMGQQLQSKLIIKTDHCNTFKFLQKSKKIVLNLTTYCDKHKNKNLLH